MRPDGSPLDLNHLPEDFTRDGKQVYEDTSTSGQRKKKNNGKDDGKVYECRFCSLKFCKSQALGGHMNRHRQERETETLNKARQLVYSTENIAAHPVPHLGSYVPPGAYPPPPPQVYPTRPLMYSGTGSTVLQPPRHPQYHHGHHQSCVYTSSTPPRLVPAGTGDYYVAHGHALTGSSPTNYTCIGAPVGLGPPGRDGLDREETGLTTTSWESSYF